jgi:hypothetical protein
LAVGSFLVKDLVAGLVCQPVFGVELQDGGGEKDEFRKSRRPMA